MTLTSLAPRWEMRRLGDLCEQTHLWNLHAEPRDELTYVDVSSVSRDSLAVVSPQHLHADAAPSRARKVIRQGDVIFATVRPRLRRIAWISPKLDGEIASTAFCVLRPNIEAVDSRFLYFSVQTQSFIDSVAQHESGAGYPAVRDKHVLDQTIAVPPLIEQRRIASVLGLIRRTMDIEQRVCDCTRELKRAAMQHLFTRGLREEPQKESAIGLIPESWNVLTLGEFGRIGNGSTPRRTQLNYWAGGSRPWLTSGKIHDGIIESANEFVTDRAARECHLPLVKRGSVLVAITGQGKTLGNVAITRIDTHVSQHLAYITIDREDVAGDFVRLNLDWRYEYLRQLGHAGGSTKGALTCAVLKTVPIPLPSLEEQKEIAQVLRAIEQKSILHERRLILLHELFDTLLHDLMTGRIRIAYLDSAELNPDAIERDV